MAMVKELKKAQKGVGLATVLAIGTATPPTSVDQSTYPDYYFKITNTEHMVDLKQKFKSLCENTTIRKRQMYLTEEHLKENPCLCETMAPSIDVRQKLLAVEIPRLGQEAAQRAIDEWGNSKNKITHLIFCTLGGVDMPGADCHLTRLLGLNPSVKRLVLYFQGFNAGASGLRLAKDIAENNKDARVLVVCSEIMTLSAYNVPRQEHVDCLLGHAIFGDGAGAIIVGADPIPKLERALFELISADQTLIPDTHYAITAHLQEVGLVVHLHDDITDIISNNIQKSLKEAFQPFGVSDWNSIFWVSHPGNRKILDKVENKLGLKPDKLRASRLTLREYGNMASASVFFVLDEMRKSSIKDGCNTTGGGLELGVLFGLGAGFTIETIVLRSVEI